MCKIYNLFTSLFLLSLTINSLGQTNTSSPYSRYGLGDLSSSMSGFSRGMGGTGIGLRMPSQINFLNPAAYTSQDTLSFIFDVGLSGNKTNYQTSSGSMLKKEASFTHLGFGFPITKWMAASFGAQPYSSVGYKIKSLANSFPDVGSVYYRNEGTGDLNRFFLGTAVKYKNLSIGINAYYMLGTLSYKNSNVPEDVNSYAFETSHSFVVKDVYFGFGAQYLIDLNDHTKLTLGATFEPTRGLKATQTKLQTQFLASEIENPFRSTEDTLFNTKDKSGHITLPSKFGLGASVIFNKKLTVAFDYSIQNWTKSEIPFEVQSNTNAMLTKSNSFNFGVQYVPNYMAIRGYFPHINYRLGGHYQDTYLSLNGQKVKDYGLSIGVGLPFKGSKNMIHINYEFGQRGTLDHNLVLEKYNVISISLSLYDFWFVKPKFD